MGRKNNRIQTALDTKFIKFMDSVNKHNCNKDAYQQQKNNQPRKRQFDSIEERNQERLRYALKQLQRERIQYEILNEPKAVVKVYHQVTGDEFIFYVSTGTLKGVENLRGLRNVIEFLYT